MAGKVLTDADFKEGDKKPEDTSSDKGGIPNADDVIDSEQKFDQDGKPIPAEEPDDKEPPEDKEPPADEEPLPKSSDDKKYKFASMDEYERAYKEAERKMHEATSEAADIKRRLAVLEKPPEKAKTIEDRIDEIVDEVTTKINFLPVEFGADNKPIPESLTKRDREAARMWAKANREIARLEISDHDKATTSYQAQVNKLYEGATKEGLKNEDELDMVGMAFERTDPGLSLEDRVKTAVGVVKTRISRLRDGFVRKQKEDRDEKDNLRVMGRGSSRTGKETEKKDDKPVSMSQQLAQMNDSRKLKKEDMY